MKALSALAVFLSLSAHAGEVTVIRPSAFIGGDTPYYIALDGRPLRDIETRQHVRFEVPAGRHVLAVRCPKALTLEYAETHVEEEFSAAPAFFVIQPKFDCVTIERVDERAAAPLLRNSSLRAGTGTTYAGGKVTPSDVSPKAPSGTAETAAVAPPAFAGAEQAGVSALTAAWVDAFNSRDPARIVALYDPQAVLIGMTAKQPAVGTAAINAYFAAAAKRPMDRVALGEHTARVYGDIAIDSGLYNFFGVEDGKAAVTPARYTFVYRKRDGQWRIVEHHSSRVP